MVNKMLRILLLQVVFGAVVAATKIFKLTHLTIQHNTGKDMVCFTLDWWPKNKCNYNLCPWEHASITLLDLQHQKLRNLVRSFPGRPLLRIGGTQGDSITYQIDGKPDYCPGFSPLPPTPAKTFSGGCLKQQRWDEILDFASETNIDLVFGLNANRSLSNQAENEWDGSNAKQLIEYTLNKGYEIYGYELGNELLYNASYFATRYRKLNNIINDVFDGSTDIAKPMIIGTDNNINNLDTDVQFYRDFLPLVSDFLGAMTWHNYPLGTADRPDLVENMLDPNFQSTYFKKADLAREAVKHSGSKIMQVWMGETGGCWNSGNNSTSNRYIDAFWYLDSLGGFALNGHTKFCRQTLYGGFYELLQRNTFEPNPDFYGAWLFQYLMGNGAFNLSTFNSTSRVYAHCSRRGPSGTIAVLAINFAKTETATFDFEFEGSSNVREEYHMTPSNGDLHSKTVLLNGVPLKTKDNKMPKMTPLRIFGSTKPVSIEPLSYSFIYYPNARVRQCMDVEAW